MLKLVLFTKTNNYRKSNNVSFCARPEFDIINNKAQNLRASSFFRRGLCYGAQDAGFKDVVDAIKLILATEKKPKILVAGIGERAQEPLSILATIKSLKNRPLKSVVELNCVDLQPKIPNGNLKECAFLDDIKSPPMFAQDCFEYSKVPSENGAYHYKLKPDILKYLKKVFNNKSKTKWDTKIEEFSSVCPEKTYDMVSINNTMGYITDEKAAKSVMENIYRMLKTGGILITDAYDDFYKRTFQCFQNYKRIAPGIWQKV